MKPPVAQFKKKSKKLFAFNPLMPGGNFLLTPGIKGLKDKSQNLILSTQLYVVCIRRKTQRKLLGKNR